MRGDEVDGPMTLSFLKYSMFQTPQSPDNNLCTFQDPWFAISPDILSREGTVGVLEINILDCFPDTVHVVRGKRNLYMVVSI